jgi:hypothetical protein
MNLDLFVDELEVPGVELDALLQQRGAHRHRPERWNAR